ICVIEPRCDVKYNVILSCGDSGATQRAAQTGGIAMRRRTFLTGAGLAGVTAGSTGCLPGFSRTRPGSEGINLRMTMWSSSPDHLALLEEIADDFLAEHEEISGVEFESLSLAQLDMLLTTGMTAGDPPYLTWHPVESSLEYIDAGALLDLAQTPAANPDYDAGDLVPELQERWRVGEA